MAPPRNTTTENAKTKTQQDTVIAASKIANGREGKPGVMADPLPPVGQPVTFTVDGHTFTGTPTRHGLVKGELMAVFDNGLTQLEG